MSEVRMTDQEKVIARHSHAQAHAEVGVFGITVRDGGRFANPLGSGDNDVKAWKNAASNLPNARPEVDIYEVHGGSSAKAMDVDVTVCRNYAELLTTLDADLDALEDGEELRIVFRRYTKEQLDEVYFA